MQLGISEPTKMDCMHLANYQKRVDGVCSLFVYFIALQHHSSLVVGVELQCCIECEKRKMCCIVQFFIGPYPITYIGPPTIHLHVIMLFHLRNSARVLVF